MEFLNTSIGRKIVMAVTGLSMVLFTVVHLLGNSSIFVGPSGINAYADGEYVCPLPVEVSAVPGALKILRPAGSL